MSLQLNQVTLAGNMTRDPQVRIVNGDQPVASFGVAINRRWKTNSGEQREEVTFVEVNAWGSTAELAGRYLTKGAGVCVVGRLRLETWTDKDNQKRSRLVVIADRIHFTTPKRDGDAEPGAAEPEATAAAGNDQPPF